MFQNSITGANPLDVAEPSHNVEARGQQNDEKSGTDGSENAVTSAADGLDHAGALLLSSLSTHDDDVLVSSWEYLGEGGKHALFFCDTSGNEHDDISNTQKSKLLRIAKSHLCMAEKMCEGEHTAGNEVISLAASDEPSLLFVRHVVAPYLSPFVDVPDAVFLTWSFLKALREKAILSGRIPPSRRSDWEMSERDQKVDIPHRPKGTLVVDYRSIFPSIQLSQEMKASYTIEIKPKAGYLTFSPLVDPKHRVKYEQSRFKSLQCLQQEGRWIKGWAKGEEVNVRISNYEPLDLFSGEKTRIEKAVTELWRAPQNNLRVWCKSRGTLVLSDRRCCDNAERRHLADENELLLNLLVEVLFSADAQDLLQRLLKWQKLDILDVDGAVLVYERLVQLCETKEAALDLVDQIRIEDVKCTGEDLGSSCVFPMLEASPFECGQMSTEEKETLRRFCRCIYDFRERLQSVGSNSDRTPVDTAVMDSSRDKLLKMIQQELSLSACAFLLRNWLLSLMMCDVSIFVTLQEHPETNGETSLRGSSRNVVEICDQGVTRRFRFSLHVIDLDPKPAKKLHNRAKIESAFQFLNQTRSG
jgi:Inositol-pentakisphosphate 2-kinase